MTRNQKWLTLRWRSFLRAGSDIVAAIFSHDGGEIFEYSLITLPSRVIIPDAKTKIVDRPLALICKW